MFVPLNDKQFMFRKFKCCNLPSIVCLPGILTISKDEKDER
jgi:hypothetical protein